MRKNILKRNLKKRIERETGAEITANRIQKKNLKKRIESSTAFVDYASGGFRAGISKRELKAKHRVHYSMAPHIMKGISKRELKEDMPEMRETLLHRENLKKRIESYWVKVSDNPFQAVGISKRELKAFCT